MSGNWVRVCGVGDVHPGGAISYGNSPKIALFNVAGEFFATADRCTHSESSLSEGYLEPDGSVECIAHMARFCVRTGAVLSPPATSPLDTYAVRIEGEDVFVEVDHGI